jgi:hypothetical protein
MTLLDRMLARGTPMPGDPILVARIERHLRRIQPDPLFRRRLRSVVVNRYVAAREGLVPVHREHRGSRQMGRLGRSVLYASVLTALGVSAVGAASQESLPGDALYGVKLQLEEIRMQIAPPGLRDDLAELALDERLEEVELLASAGRWDLVRAAAGSAAAAEARLDALRPASATRSGAVETDERLNRHVERLTQLLATAPATARDGLEQALATSQHHAAGSRDRPGGTPEPPTTGGAAPRGGATADPPAQPPRDGEEEPGSQGPESGNREGHGQGSTQGARPDDQGGAAAQDKQPQAGGAP